MSNPGREAPTNPGEVLDLPLDLSGPGSQAARLHGGLRAAILGGRLGAGLRLPASRALAAQLGLPRHAVIAAYERLLSDGLAEARVGAGTYVAAQVPRAPAAAPPPELPVAAGGALPFALGRTLPDPAFQAELARALARRVRSPDPGHFGYGDPRGDAGLRAAVAAHLAATRGVSADPGRIVVTPGAVGAMRLVLGAALRPGDQAWVEDPGYHAARRVLEAVGARLVPAPVDALGLDVAAGRARAPGARLAYVTPSHQFPTGVTMAMPRRLALLDWAREAGAWVLEDDYDSEFRYAGPPLTALAGIDGGGRVVYVGTFSKTLFPGLRLGYAVLPDALLAPVLAARLAMDRASPAPLEAALGDVMASGAFAAHLRRVRGRYRAARDAVAGTLAREAGPALRLLVPDQGLHLVATLPEDAPAGTGAAIRAAAGIEGWLLSETRLVPGAPEGFVLGYSGHSLPALRAAAARLGRAARAMLHPGSVPSAFSTSPAR